MNQVSRKSIEYFFNYAQEKKDIIQNRDQAELLFKVCISRSRYILIYQISSQTCIVFKILLSIKQ